MRHGHDDDYHLLHQLVTGYRLQVLVASNVILNSLCHDVVRYYHQTHSSDKSLKQVDHIPPPPHNTDGKSH